MKKKVMFLSIFLVVTFVLTGCGSKDKKLTCSVTAEEAKFLMLGDNQNAVITFKDNKASAISIEMIVKTESKEKAEEYKEQYEKLINLNSSSKMTTKVDETNLIITETIDNVSDMSEEDVKDSFGDDTSYDGIKKYFEEQGYSCK